VICYAKAITGHAAIEIILREREVSGFATIAEIPGDIRLAQTVTLAIMGWQDPAGIARARHTIGKLPITGSTLIAFIS